MDCSTPGFPVHHQLPELAQTHVHQVGVAIQPSHLLLSPSPHFTLSQHHGLFQGVNSSYWVAKVLEIQLQLSVLLMNIQGWFPLGLTDLISMIKFKVWRENIQSPEQHKVIKDSQTHTLMQFVRRTQKTTESAPNGQSWSKLSHKMNHGILCYSSKMCELYLGLAS